MIVVLSIIALFVTFFAISSNFHVRTTDGDILFILSITVFFFNFHLSSFVPGRSEHQTSKDGKC